MKKLYLLLIPILIGYNLFGQSNFTRVWEFNDPDFYSSIQSFKKGPIIYSLVQNSNAIKLDKIHSETGLLIWSRTVLTTPGTISIVYSRTDSLSNFYLAGSVVSTAGMNDALLLKIDSAGTTLFTKIYNSPGNKNDRYNDIDVDKQLNVYAIGESNATSFGTDPINPIYVETGPIKSPENSLFIYPYKPDVNSSTNYTDSKILVSAFNSNGTALWNTTIGGLYRLNAIGSKIRVGGSNSIYVAGIACNEKDTINFFARRFNSPPTSPMDLLYKNYFFWGPVVRKLSSEDGTTVWEKIPNYNSSLTRIPFLGTNSRIEGNYTRQYIEKVIGLEIDSASNPLILLNYQEYTLSSSSYSYGLNSSSIKFQRYSPSGTLVGFSSLNLNSSVLLTSDYKIKYGSIYLAYGTWNSSSQNNFGRVAKFNMSFVNQFISAPSDIGPYSVYNSKTVVDVDSSRTISLAFDYQVNQSRFPLGTFVNQYQDSGTPIRTLANVYKSSNSVVNQLISDNNGSIYVGGRFDFRNLLRICFSEIPALPVSQTICPVQSISITNTAPGVVSYSWTPLIGVSNPSNGTTNLTPSSTSSFTQNVVFKDGCRKSSSITIAVRKSMSRVNLKNDTTICMWDSLFLTTSLPYPKVQWSTGSTSAGIWVKYMGTNQKIKVSVTDSCQQISSDSLLLSFQDCRTPLLVRAFNASKVYGQPNPIFTGTVTGLKPNDQVNVTYTISGTTIYPIMSGAALPKYILSTIGGLLTITPAPLTITAFNATKVYGQPNPTFTGTVVGLVNGDNVNVSYALVGSSIVPSVSGNALPNYALTTVAGTLTITKASLTITAFNATKVYGQPNPTFTGTVVGLVNGDNVNVSYALVGSSIVPSVSGNALPNYALTTVAGVLTITKASQTITGFDFLPTLTVGGTFTLLNVVASSGLPVVFESSDLSIVSVVGNQLIALTYGVATITAIQSGDNNYYPAQSLETEIQVENGITTGDKGQNYLEKNTYKLYPNPFEESFTIQSAESFEYELTDAYGKVVSQGSSDKSLTIDTWVPSGVYVLHVKSKGKSTYTRLVKK